MGRSLNWYILPKNIEHDKSKQLCLDIEYQPEKDDCEIRHKLYNIINPDAKKIDDRYIDTDTFKKWIEESRLRDEEEKKLERHYLYSDDKKNCWCPMCLMYINGLYDTSLVIDSFNISHSYSNPIWGSDWNVKNLYMGDSTTDFVRCFDNDQMYREISKDDVERAFKTIENTGKAIRVSDREAKEETLQVLEFLKKYMEDDNVRMIISDEY